MNAETIYAALVIAALIWWMWRANKPKKPDDTGYTSPPKAIEGHVAPMSERRKPEADPFLDAIQKERLEAEEQAGKEISAYKASVERQVKDDEVLKARLTKFASDNKLDVALAQLWDEMKHYPTWSKRDDWHQWNKLGLEEVASDNVAAPYGDGTLSFSYEGVKYAIKTRSWSGMESESYKDFTLFEIDDEVFGISTQVSDDAYITHYRPWSVTAFKKQGNWATMLVKLYAKLKLANEKSSADFRVRSAADIRAKFAE